MGGAFEKRPSAPRRRRTGILVSEAVLGTPFASLILWDPDFLAVTPEDLGILTVSFQDGVHAVPGVESHGERIGHTHLRADGIFPEKSGVVTRVFQNVREGDINFPQLDLVRVVMHETAIPAREQGDPGRRADRIAGIGLRKPDAAGGEAIEIGCLDRSVPVAAELVEAKIIGEDKDDVRSIPVGFVGSESYLKRARGHRDAHDNSHGDAQHVYS